MMRLWLRPAAEQDRLDQQALGDTFGPLEDQ